MMTKVTTRGQVSIPANVRKKFHIEPESRLEWLIEGNTIKVVPLPKDAISAFRGKGSKRYAIEQLLNERQSERNTENEKDG